MLVENTVAFLAGYDFDAELVAWVPLRSQSAFDGCFGIQNVRVKYSFVSSGLFSV